MKSSGLKPSNKPWPSSLNPRKPMKSGRSTGTPTKAQAARFSAIKEIGCIACDINGLRGPSEIHHLTIGGKHGQKRRGHDYTIGLCPYHHRGELMENIDWCLQFLGPSYARESRKFRETFGNDDVLLELQNKLIGEL